MGLWTWQSLGKVKARIHPNLFVPCQSLNCRSLWYLPAIPSLLECQVFHLADPDGLTIPSCALIFCEKNVNTLSRFHFYFSLLYAWVKRKEHSSPAPGDLGKDSNRPGKGTRQSESCFSGSKPGGSCLLSSNSRGLDRRTALIFEASLDYIWDPIQKKKKTETQPT